LRDRTLLRTGIVGAVVAAICCFTPLLVVLLGIVGLSAWRAWLDYVLLPALVLFLGLAGWALIRHRMRRGGD
jgi:mercuric ion transport protein